MVFLHARPLTETTGEGFPDMTEVTIAQVQP